MINLRSSLDYIDDKENRSQTVVIKLQKENLKFTCNKSHESLLWF